MSDKNIIDIGSGGAAFFPYQKRSEARKSDKFYSDCISAGMSLIDWNEDFNQSGPSTRPSFRNKLINYNLYNDVVDEEEVSRVINPRKLHGVDFPIKYRNYPLINPNINILLGEERKRHYEPIVLVLDDDAITERQRTIRQKIDEFLLEKLIGSEQSEREIAAELKQLEHWKTYDFKDLKARLGSQVLRYLYKTLDLHETFSRGFEDLLVAGEEIYVIDIEGREPILRKANPLCFYTIRSGNSHRLEDAEVIVEDGYWPVGKVIDVYYDWLTEKNIDELERGHEIYVQGKGSLWERPQLTYRQDKLEQSDDISNIITATGAEAMAYGGAFDEEGNVRVTRVLWKGMRKVYIRKYFDVDEGEWIEDLVPEQYEPDEELGEDLEPLWITEWYEGTRLANKIDVKKQPRPVDIRSMDNLSESHPGIVGTVFNINTGKGRSMMDMGRDLQLVYNAFMYNTEKAFAKAKGKIGRMPLHSIPDGWEVDKWMYYAEEMGWAVEDEFREGKSGQAMGKLSGHLNKQTPVIDLEMGEYIQNHIHMLDFIKRRADEICGITEQRKGAVHERETVGGIERAVQQSSLITEKWFSLHDDTKTRALRVLLETAKAAWKGKSLKRHYVLDDGTQAVLELDGDEFAMTEYGVDVADERDVTDVMQSLRQLSQHFAQAGAPMSMIAELYTTKSPTELKRKIQKYEEDIEETRQQEMEAQQQVEQQQQAIEREQQQIENELKRIDQEIEMYRIDTDAEVKLLVEAMKQEGQEVSASAMDHARRAIEERKTQSEEKSKEHEASLKEQELKLKRESEKKKQELEDKKLRLEEKKIDLDKKKTEQQMKQKKMKYDK